MTQLRIFWITPKIMKKMLHKFQKAWAQIKSVLVSIRDAARAKLTSVADKVIGMLRSFLWAILSVLDSFKRRLQPYDSIMGHAFMRDFRTFLFPSRSENNPDYRIQAVPPTTSEAIERLLGNERSRDLERTVERFMQDLVQRLLIWHKTTYALIDNADGKELKLLAGQTYNFGFFHIHFVSKRHAEDARIRGIKPEPQFFWRKDIFVFKLPKNVATKRQQRKIVKALVNTSKLLPKFAKGDMEEHKIESGFSYTDYHRASMIELLIATKPLGMNMHGMLDRLGTGYYDVELAIRFYRALAVLRDELSHQINELLLKSGIEGRVEIVGLPVATEMDKVSLELEEGNIDFAEAWKRMRL